MGTEALRLGPYHPLCYVMLCRSGHRAVTYLFSRYDMIRVHKRHGRTIDIAAPLRSIML